MPKDVLEIVKKYLEDNGFDGLFNVNGECACPVGALCQCDECFSECEPGYRVEGCTCGQGCDYHIVRDKPIEKCPICKVVLNKYSSNSSEAPSLVLDGWQGSGTGRYYCMDCVSAAIRKHVADTQ